MWVDMDAKDLPNSNSNLKKEKKNRIVDEKQISNEDNDEDESTREFDGWIDSIRFDQLV